jgi:predicted HD phosphohydrolase
MQNIIEEIIFNFSNNKSLYIGENVTIADHMLQTAMLAEKNKSPDNLICASLLHDYGHFLVEGSR